MRTTLRALAVCVVTMAVISGGAVAATVITGKNVRNNSLTGADIRSIRGGDITNGSISNSDIRRGTIRLDKLSSGTQALIRKAGTPGANGAPGAPGSNAAGVVGENWSIIARNQIGSPAVFLANGPIVTGSAPNYGKGSLSISVANNSQTGATTSEKAAFGNEVDFAGKTLASITETGFRVFTTDENSDVGGNDAAQGNLPNIAFEVDPGGSAVTTGLNYSTLVWSPAALTNADENKWTGYLNAATTGSWHFTGAAGGFKADGTTVDTTCSSATPCSLAAAKTKFPAATLLTAAISKGRDSTWVGNVDGFRVNNDLYDFESYGVVKRAP